MDDSPLQFAVLGSTRGSSLIPILEGRKRGAFDSKLRVIVSNKKDSGILEKARQNGIEDLWIPVKGRDRESYDREVSEVLKTRGIDFILLIGFMRIFSPYFVREWPGRIINVHPSLLPKHGGLMDLDVHRSVLDAGDSESGCSIHIVTEAVDEGPVVLQKKCAVEPQDTPESLRARVQPLEGEAFLEILKDPRKYLELRQA